MKKTLSLLLSLCIMGTMFVGISLPAAASTSGTTGKCTWTLDGTTLTISGKGAMASYYHNDGAPWGTSVTGVVIENGVTNIGNYAFSNCASLTSVTLADSITWIGNYAFSNCDSLTSIDIPDSVIKITAGAFYNCGSLTDVAIPNSVSDIGGAAFRGCSSLKSITIPDNVTVIGDEAFYNCGSLTSIAVPNSVTSLGRYAFYGCSSLTSVTIPDGITGIGGATFQGCISLKSVTIPDSVTSIGYSAFYGCSSLTGITIPNDVTSIDTSAFNNCINLASITLPDRVTSIGYDVFYNTAYYNDDSNWQDNALYMGKCLIGVKPFVSGSFEIKEGIRTIGGKAFLNCTGLTGITIPDSITRIGTSAFEGCSSLTSVTIPDGVTTIGTHAFLGCSSLTNIKIPDAVTWIGKYAFSGCSGLTSVVISNAVTSIDECSFQGCSSLKSITIPDRVVSIGDSVFDGCSSLESIAIPDRVTSIGPNAFYNTAYYNSSSNWEDGVLYIGKHLIAAKTSVLESCEIKEGTKTIADRAFDGCESLKSITVPDSVTDIGAYAFYYCDNLEAIHYMSTESQWEAISKGTNAIPSVVTVYYHSNHDYRAVIVEPTCTDVGYTTYTCTVCGERYISEVIEAVGHIYDDGVVTAPNCTDAGYTTYTCTVCGDSYTANKVAALGHSYDEGVVTVPTETTQGYTTYTCTVCNNIYKGDYVDATGVINGVQNMKVTCSDTNVVATWDALDGVTKYNLYVKNEEGETIITRALAADRTSVTLSWPTELEWDKNYVIGIRAKTTTWLTTVYKDAKLEVAGRIVGVKTQSVGRTIKVDWRAYEGATQYYVYVYEKGAYPTTFTSVKATTNSATIINAINPEVDYEVRVIATKGVAKMATVDALSVDARLNVFTPDTFTERGITPNKVAVGFDEVRGADKYWVYLTAVGSDQTIVKESTKAIAAIGSLVPNTTYNVQIQARIVDANGTPHYSGMSKVLGTITTNDWEDVSFAATSTSSGAELSWTAPANAYSYIIYCSTNGGKSYKKLADISDPTTVSYTDTAAKNGYMYAIVTQIQDDFVTAKSPLFKSSALIK